MSPRFAPFDAHLPIYLTLIEPPPSPYPTLTKAARHLHSYLRSRAVRMPSPLWFGSAVHLSMMANMPFALGGKALLELLAAGLIERQVDDPPRSRRPAELQAGEPFALTRLEPIGSMPMLYGPAREVWQWLEWLTAEGQGRRPRLVFPSLPHCASASSLSRERLYLGLRQLYDNGLVRFEQPLEGIDEEGGGQ